MTRIERPWAVGVLIVITTIIVGQDIVEHIIKKIRPEVAGA